MRIFAVIAAIASIVIASPAFADRYEFDKSHTNVAFFVNHLGFSNMLGRFTDYDGYFIFDQKAPDQSSVDITLKPSGIKTSSELLDTELQGEKFFQTEKFPDMHFVSTQVRVTGKQTADVIGNLTMLGITKQVVLKVRFNKADYHPMTGDFIAGFSVDATVRRSDFGMTAYIPMVGDEVYLTVQVEGVNVDRKKALEEKKPK